VTTALTCSIAGISNGDTCSDTNLAHNVSVVATDKVSVRIQDTRGGTIPVATYMFALNCK
jgi:hypothetical protein